MEETTFLQHAPPRLKLACMLLIYTAQRPSDVLAMTKGQVIERGDRLMIMLRQQKTGELIAVPLHATVWRPSCENECRRIKVAFC